MKTANRIAQLAQIACIWEACAPKPGNVNRCHDFSDTSLEDFLLSAIAIGPAFEMAGQSSIGQIIRQAVANTRQWVRSNTNLGLVLLLAPLTKACLTMNDESKSKIAALRSNLHAVLNTLAVEDARLAYDAIRLARPCGLGQVSQADVVDEPSITLLQAMALAQERDSIAHEYITDYAITFEIGLPVLKEALSQDLDLSSAIVQTFLTILSQVPDTLIARKKGSAAARKVSQLAEEVLIKGGVLTFPGRERLAEMDRVLREDAAHTLNPGTTADLTAAAIFLALIENPGLLETSGSFS
jgi:triphosphoribosyl-dephospho-CoA synthase